MSKEELHGIDFQGYKWRTVNCLLDHIWIEIYSPHTNGWIMMEPSGGHFGEHKGQWVGWGKRKGSPLVFVNDGKFYNALIFVFDFVLCLFVTFFSNKHLI